MPTARPQRVQVDLWLDDVVAVHHHLPACALAGIQVVHPVQHTQQGGFTASRRTDHAGHLTIREIQGDLFQGPVTTVEKVKVADGDTGRVQRRAGRACLDPRRSCRSDYGLKPWCS